MKIILDPQTYNEQKFGGISRYYTEIYVALRGKKDVEIECPIVFSENLHLKEYGLFRNFRNAIANSKLFGRKKRKKIADNYRKQNVEKTKKVLRNQDFDLFVPTYYSPYFLESLGNKPFVLTVYDMIHEVLPQYFGFDTTTVPNKKLLMEKATRIIAISESTKKDILRFYPHIDANKIDIVYLSQSIKFDPNVSLDLPRNYILFVGNRTIYKNFTFFIRSVAPLLRENPELFVVCAGGNGFEPEEKTLLHELGISNQVKQQNFEDNELATYYSKAKCFVFPSEYEGFGIPVLEAMACGCPVVLANHSSFPEVAGEAGVYFELNNAADLKHKVAELLQNDNLRNDYVQKGLAQAQKFSWQKTAEECLKVYQKAI
ncbi:glycosyltransferase family 4 protein [Flavobacterium sp.]|uniref:glycosyltransferase family 4 protein n=1 Tax=Flavobacterium sp. TaxID=239 RepID=UPI0039E43B8E